MIRKGKYNEVTDIKAVDQIGWIDIGEAIKNGFVPGSLEADDMVYNEIDDPASMMHTASDTFELYRQADYIKTYKPSNGESSESDSATE